MKQLIEFVLTFLASLFSALCTWWAWNEVAYLFPGLPSDWQHLSFMKCFFLAWLLRLLTTIMRAPTPEIDLKAKISKSK